MLNSIFLAFSGRPNRPTSKSRPSRRFIADTANRPLLCSFGNEEDGDEEEAEGGGTSSRQTADFHEMMANGETGSSSSSRAFPSTNDDKRKYQSDSFTHRRLTTGMGWITAALFIVADMAGGGVVAIPIALLNSGLLVGSLSMFSIGTAFCYTAHILGQNWLTMCRRWPQIYGREHCRKPYPEMAFRAMGERARLFMSCTLNVMLFGISVVYILLGAKIISELWVSLLPAARPIGPCTMSVLLAAALLPVTFLKSPQDFWWAVVLAMATTTLAVLLILLGSLLDLPNCAPSANQPPFRPSNYFLSIGIFFFAFGGHGVFPTIQHDMRRPRNFTRSSLLAFAVVAAMYVPISYLGYFVYGDSLHDSIISSIQTDIVQQFANLFIALHCILTLTIVINPLNQEFEHLVNVPHHFCWQRALVRTGVMASVVFVALTLPSFGPILNLIGGTTVALTSAVLPCLFFLYLHAAEGNPKKDDHQIPSLKEVITRTPAPILALNIGVIVIAVICGLAATNSALHELATSKFSGPCYLPSASGDGPAGGVVESIHCCGPFRNISNRWPDKFQCPAYTQLTNIGA